MKRHLSLAMGFLLISILGHAQVTILARSHFGAVGACFDIAHFDAKGQWVQSRQGHLGDVNNLLDFSPSEDDRLVLKLREFRPDGKVILEIAYSVKYDENIRLIAIPDRGLDNVAVRLGQTLNWEDHVEWEFGLDD